MSEPNPNTREIDGLLQAWSDGDQQVEAQLIELMYPHIHRIAHFQIKSSSASALQTTELVNEAFIRISDQKSVDWQNKDHFLAIAAKVIRRVIVDHYRSELSQKRGGLEQHVTLEKVSDLIENAQANELNWLELDAMLLELSEIDAEAARVVEYKVFGGMTIPEMAHVMQVSPSTVSRNWQFARSWLLMQFK
ncbi:ECF-type sigma factor [Marinicella meishanensis]|uniref:ECF-type sigma factor n=1 Tax=Marinicella meishanensis TaxID=2873263 RepID=UPI001CBF3AA0|nr:ECF-type sigma factor [Marinicella sp. NBU2979]